MKRKKRSWKFPIITLTFTIIAIAAYVAWAAVLTPLTGKEGTYYIYVDKDDTPDSIADKVCDNSTTMSARIFRFAANHERYNKTFRTGRYAVEPGISAIKLLRHLQHGAQSPVRLTINTARTTQQLAGRLSKKLMTDSASIATLLTDTAFCHQYDCTPATVITLFIPNTYEVYWDITPEALIERMSRECKAFWNDERKAKAQETGLSIHEVMTLASIIDQETNNVAEKPIIAGLYINRLRKGMKLQACPTAKFASGKFLARRVTNDIISTDSPYNTYKYAGLPPGPICIPSIADIDAVLSYHKSNYLFMCAKEDFSGRHNFAATGAQHMQNARRYRAALNRRGVR